MIYSPTTDYTILVTNELTRKKTKRIGKLLLTCSVRELHNDLIKDLNTIRSQAKSAISINCIFYKCESLFSQKLSVLEKILLMYST